MSVQWCLLVGLCLSGRVAIASCTIVEREGIPVVSRALLLVALVEVTHTMFEKNKTNLYLHLFDPWHCWLPNELSDKRSRVVQVALSSHSGPQEA
jgi:hypothetical protein